MTKIIDGIIGHAIGDAMGVPVEFKDRESLMYNPVTEMRRSYAGDKGTWSDDTSMEIATMDAFINNNGWNYDDIMINFGDWINDSRFTAHDYTFDVGRTCLTAIRNYLQKGTPALESGLDDIKSSGYVVDTLEASMWVVLKTDSYKESIIGSVNLGGDTDTIGAITGSMTGIIYGYKSIPEDWINNLARREYIEDLCNKFEQTLKQKCK